MLVLAYPWFALLSPLPLLVWLAMPAYTEKRGGLRVPFFRQLAELTGSRSRSIGAVSPRSWFRLMILISCWLLTVGALMRPQWLEPPVHREQPARDMLLLVDLSASMDTADFIDAQGRKASRLDVVRQVLDDFLSRRKGDRIGVVVFGNAPFTLVPFTTDLELCRTLLKDMAAGLAGPRTAFGDGIGLAIRMYEKSHARARTIIALTDGNDTASRVPPLQAAGIARDKGIVIHTIAIGDPTSAGEEKLDEQTLKDVAQTTGGGFFRAVDREGLSDIYTRLNAMETQKVDIVSYRPRRDIFWYPLIGVIALSMLLQLGRSLTGNRRQKTLSASSKPERPL